MPPYTCLSVCMSNIQQVAQHCMHLHTQLAQIFLYLNYCTASHIFLGLGFSSLTFVNLTKTTMINELTTN